MNNILEEIAEYTKLRVKKAKEKVSLEEMKQRAYALADDCKFSFEEALRKDGISFICECKKASPSKGVIADEFPYLRIAKEYESAEASCISVLTEPRWFLGNDDYLREIANAVSIPCLRKDFTVDEYMIYEAKTLSASAVLLICSLLTEEELYRYHSICDELGLSAVVETHDEDEMKMAINVGARIIGVNNRNLNDFSVDVGNSQRLIKMAPKDTVFIAESGIKTAEDIRLLREINVDAVLIGETLMRANNKRAMLDYLKGNISSYDED